MKNHRTAYVVVLTTTFLLTCAGGLFMVHLFFRYSPLVFPHAQASRISHWLFYIGFLLLLSEAFLISLLRSPFWERQASLSQQIVFLMVPPAFAIIAVVAQALNQPTVGFVLGLAVTVAGSFYFFVGPKPRSKDPTKPTARGSDRRDISR